MLQYLCAEKQTKQNKRENLKQQQQQQKTMFNIRSQDSCELVCLKLGMMLNTTKLYSLIPV